MNNTRADVESRSRAVVWAVALGLTAGMFMLWRSFYCVEWAGIGLGCDRAFRIARGQTPYRDFFSPTTPLLYYSLALWFKIFGLSYRTSQVYAAVQCGLVVALTVSFCRIGLGFGKLRATFMGILQSIWAPTMMSGMFSYDGDASLYTLLTGIFLFAANRKPERERLFAFLAGAAAGLAFWAKQDIGAGAVAGACAGVFLLAVLPSRKGRSLVLPFGAGLGCIFGAAAIFFLFKGAFLEMIFWVFKRSLMVKWGAGKGPGGLIKLISPFTTTIDRSSKYVALLFAVACASGWIKTLTGRGKDDPALGAACLVFLGAFYAGVMTHNGQGYSVSVAYFCAALAMLWSQVERAGEDIGRPRLVSTVFCAFYVAIGLRGWRYLGNLVPKGSRHILVAERLRGIHVPAETGPGLDRMIHLILMRIPPQDAFLSFDYDLIPYFATDRLCPLPVTTLGSAEGSRELDEAILIKAASKPEVRWLLSMGTPDSLRDSVYLSHMPGLLDYLLKNFKVSETLDGPLDQRLLVWRRI